MRAGDRGAANQAADNCQAFGGAKEGLREHFEDEGGDAKETARRLQHQGPGRGAEQREGNDRQHRAQLQGSTSFRFIAQSAQVVLRVRGHDAREIVWKIDAGRAAESRFQRAQELSLATQLMTTTGTFRHVRFEVLERSAG